MRAGKDERGTKTEEAMVSDVGGDEVEGHQKMMGLEDMIGTARTPSHAIIT